MAQLTKGLVAGSTFIAVVAIKVLHSYLIHENAVAFNTLGMSAKTYRAPLVVFGAVLTMVEAAVSSYWHCTTAWVHPAAILYALVNGAMLLVALVWIARARHVPSPSHEPRKLAFAVANMVMMLAVMGGLISLDVSVVQRYQISSTVAAVTATLATGVHTFADKGRLSELESTSSRRPVLSTASRVSGKAMVDLDLCVLDHTSRTASALTPVRVQSGGRLARWRPCEVEIAKDYQYMTCHARQRARSTTTFYALPYRSIATDDKAWIVAIAFKSGSVLEFQARDVDNLSEWKRVLDVGHEKSLLTPVRPNAKRVAGASGATKGATSGPRQGAKKTASISRKSMAPGKTRLEPGIGTREETEQD
ncbi:hypothetical protein AMAG_03594 [Allomyces macrogynus ATCC 38327]|uniref:PH domain-containing protein n=1 Tax=Allomyces macrogynus (strain ATCC 38327) TaxID=578462 RepID=A0A0L0SA22_ALLM3|nr:hypothetical protein AMAG_03594 [Allomyces macrogynus ATCC 38327]|eukprot:KNE59287.1 hypothetical protein AMAG_03594 [Allomyces macrogynus ATCC 38327]